MSELKPKKTKDGLTFYPVPKFNDASIAFGAEDKDYFKRNNLPDVPRKYKDMALRLFYKGGALPDGVSPKVDKADAMRYLQAMLGSWSPSHEAKESTVGYALWVWHTDEIL